jgi:hypothetical protein
VEVHYTKSLPSALNSTLASAGKFVSPEHYLIMRGTFIITKVSALSDEIPVDDNYEIGVVDSWFRYCAERELDSENAETYMYPAFARAMVKARGSSSRKAGVSIGRNLVGMRRGIVL